MYLIAFSCLFQANLNNIQSLVDNTDRQDYIGTATTSPHLYTVTSLQYMMSIRLLSSCNFVISNVEN
jgi:hypothetical protein